jgi:hypothetical protein
VDFFSEPYDAYAPGALMVASGVKVTDFGVEIMGDTHVIYPDKDSWRLELLEFATIRAQEFSDHLKIV